MVADMRPPLLLASQSINNFSNLCPLTTFDNQKCLQALQLQSRHFTFLHKACRIDEVNRGSVLGPEILTGFGFGLPQVSQLKIVFCQCFLFLTKIIDHGGRCGASMRALARWQHPVASSEALNVLHRLICPASHRHIRMVIEISSICLLFLSRRFHCWPQP